ncbi:MAG: histidine kinase [Oscillospiraceae bacterium]|nr:histidine kinase [Oscillospiraceae bacterium]
MKIYFLIARILAGLVIIVLWSVRIDGSPLLGIVFVLALTATSAIRYRFVAYKWLPFIEVAITVPFAFYWLPAWFGLLFPTIGFVESKWVVLENELTLQNIEINAKLLKLLRERSETNVQLKNIARLTELNERTRIAQDIHDHVGHEIAGALLALQTADSIYGGESAKSLLEQTIQRLEQASAILRETVYNLKPSSVKNDSGFVKLKEFSELCDEFSFCEVEFQNKIETKDFTKFDEIAEFDSVMGLFCTNLKEALTNVSRHSNATLVRVELDSNRSYFRMSFDDNGTTSQKSTSSLHLRYSKGLGLAGMKERSRKIGGNLTISTENGFRIVCIVSRKCAFIEELEGKE